MNALSARHKVHTRYNVRILSFVPFCLLTVPLYLSHFLFVSLISNVYSMCDKKKKTYIHGASVVYTYFFGSSSDLGMDHLP